MMFIVVVLSSFDLTELLYLFLSLIIIRTEILNRRYARKLVFDARKLIFDVCEQPRLLYFTTVLRTRLPGKADAYEIFF